MEKYIQEVIDNMDADREGILKREIKKIISGIQGQQAYIAKAKEEIGRYQKQLKELRLQVVSKETIELL